MNSNKHLPLVSIPVITYNSAKTVVETLDSISNQTYSNIELIISDDCSTDNTVELCQNWVKTHKERFEHIGIITTTQNTGVAANMNRAVQACNGEWVKPIAGDDILLPHCIQTYIDYIESHPAAIYLFSKIECFGANEERNQQVATWFKYDFFDLSPEQQEDRLLMQGNCIPASTAFFNRKEIQKLGLKYDERIPLYEDCPMWVNIIRAGIRLYLIDCVTVRYRISETSLSTSSKQSAKYQQSYAIFCKYYIYPYAKKVKNNRKQNILMYLRAEKIIHNNAFFWRVIVFMYKKLFHLQ